MAKPNKKGKTSVSKTLEEFPPQVAAAFSALSVIRRNFVIAYCGTAHGNGKLAAQMVGIKGGHLGQACWASNQVRHPLVRSAIEAWMQAYAMSATEITARLTDMAQINPGPFFEINKDGKLALRDKMTEADWEAHKHWVKKIVADDKGHVIELELHDSHAALRDIAKINKMYSEAPIFGFHLHISQLTDAELLRQLTEAREEDLASQQPRLPPGEPVIVIEAPTLVPEPLPVVIIEEPPLVALPLPAETPPVVTTPRVKTPPQQVRDHR